MSGEGLARRRRRGFEGGGAIYAAALVAYMRAKLGSATTTPWPGLDPTISQGGSPALTSNLDQSDSANDAITPYIKIPDSIEFRFVKNEIDRLRREVGDDFNAVHVITVSGPVWTEQRNELGEPSLRHGPNIRPVVTAALRELGIRRDVRVTHSSPDAPSQWTEWGTVLKGLALDSTAVRPTTQKTIIIDASRLNFRR